MPLPLLELTDNDPTNPATVTRFLMLDMSSGVKFSWLSATDIYQMALAQKVALFPPKMMSSKWKVNDEAMDWSIKRVTEKNPSIMIFNSISDAGSHRSTQAILASPCPSAWTLEATIKIQQVMMYVLNNANKIMKDYEWRIAYTLLSLRQEGEVGMDFQTAINVVYGVMPNSLEEATSIFYEKSAVEGHDYLAFANKAAVESSSSIKTYGIYEAYLVLIRLSNKIYLESANNLYRNTLSKSYSNATSDEILVPVLDRPLAEMEFKTFGINSRIFNASVDGVTKGLRVDSSGKYEVVRA